MIVAKHSEQHQRNTAVLGMWVFLSTEALLFSVVLLSIFLYRNLYSTAFASGTQHLNRILGTINTAVLLTSSWTMARAVHWSEKEDDRRSFRNLAFTLVLGLIFLGVKAYEYYQHGTEHLVPALDWAPEGNPPAQYQLFFVLYFLSTGLHALHLIIGCGLVALSAMMSLLSTKRYRSWIENVGLYWHFVDLVWVWLFPLLYLVGRKG